MRPESVKRTVFLVVCNDTLALAVFHNQVNGKVLDEVTGVVSQGLAVECVEHGVAGSVSSRCCPISLTAFAVVAGLSAEGTLIAKAVVSW